jgi:hypothetical protein
MNRMSSDKFYMAMFALFIGALAVGCVVFVIGMREASYVINDGIGYSVHYFNKPRYDSQLQGLIFALAFLVAGVLLLMLIILPNQGQPSAQRVQGPPQPRQRAPRPAPAVAAAPAPAALPRREPEPAAEAAPQAEMAVVPPELEPAAAAPAARPAETRSVEEEVLSISASVDDLPALESADSRFDDAGEDDVVYGTGRITDDAIWEFVQGYPDSAVKFLYRKTLDNKPLSPADEDIYRKWEGRGMARSKVRQIVLDLMQWKSLPDEFPHNIWRELRDQIFEMRIR